MRNLVGELKLTPLFLLDVSEDEEKKAKAEGLMKPVDVSGIKIPADITDEKFDHLIYCEAVITRNGYTYEFEQISTWLEKNNTDPADNTELEDKTLVKNKSCVSRVNQFLDKYPQVRNSTELYLPRHWVSDLELACHKADLDAIKRLYDLDRRLFSWTFDFAEEKYAAYQGKNILHIACVRGKPEAVIKLLEFMEKCAEGLALLMLRQKDKHGKLPIQYAMENEIDLLLMRVIALKMGKHLNGVEPVLLSTLESQESRYRTVLQIAAMNNDANTISFLAEHKADLNTKDKSGNTALHIALSCGSNEATETLIRLGASEVIENDLGQTPEKVGETNGKAGTVQVLKEALEQRTKAQQQQLKDAGPLAQMVLGMKVSLDQLTAKTQKQETQIDELQTAITLLYHEIGFLRLTGHFLSRELVYDRRHKQSGGGFFGLSLFLSEKPPIEGAQTFWEPKRFGIDKPLSKKELRKHILENLSPHTQKALFYVEEKGSSTDYQFSQLTVTGDRHLLTAVDILPNSQIISSYTDGTIRIWDSKGTCTKSLEVGGSSSVTVMPDGGFISSSGTLIKIWNTQGKCLNTIETKNDSNRWEWNYGSVRRLAVLPDGRIIIGEGHSFKIWEQKGECTSTIALGKPEYKRLIVDSNPPAKIESGILYITVDEKAKQCNIRSTDIKSPINFVDKNYLFSKLSRLLQKPGSRELDLSQNITEADRIRGLIIVFKVNESPNLTSLVIWNNRIVVGLNDKTIKVWQADGNFLVMLSGHTTPVCALATSPDGNLVSVDGEGILKFWDNDFKCVDTRLFNIKSITSLKTFSNGTLVISTNEKIFFWSKAHGYLPSFLAKEPFSILPDAQAILYAAENIIKYVFVGKPMLLNFSFQKELLLANAKLHMSNQALIVKTIRPCSEGIIGLAAALKNLCSEFEFNIEFTETELCILNLTNIDLMTDLENLCQLFGAAKFIPAPRPIVKPTTQPVSEEVKKHRVTGSIVSSPNFISGFNWK